VGPMQFIPTTWHAWGADGNGDGKADPGNIFDATLAAGRYLCHAAGPLTLRTRDGVIRAILSYNPNLEYLRVVGARYEALASDVAHGWFSTGDLALPATPVPTDGNADGGHPPSDAAFAPPGTEVHTLSVFGPNGLTASTSGDVLSAVCGPSAVMAGRSGFLQCASPGGAQVLDPCIVSPADPTLLACVRDPQQPVRLVRAPTPPPQTPTAPAPPFVALVLSGGDLCLPVAPPGTTTPPTPIAPGASTTAPVTPTTPPAAPTNPPAPTTTASTTPRSTSATSGSTTAPPTTTTSTTAAPTTAAGATGATAAEATVMAADVTPAYACASGVSVTAQPNTSTPAWTVPIMQPGAPNRTVTVAAAWS
ncbi:MAG TPA: lytic transglycosylase domain-containing protein, partial [Acidimicrobiales bacterium]|nr:lytic transglycosylase domain-containing protein [Acidimicrobiales bacterium]